MQGDVIGLDGSVLISYVAEPLLPACVHEAERERLVRDGNSSVLVASLYACEACIGWVPCIGFVVTCMLIF